MQNSTEQNRQHEQPAQRIFTVSELNHIARELLECHFSTIWLEGEISNFAAPSSGHWYFSLKDKNAQVRCAMFRGKNFKVKFQPENGMQIRVRANVSLYEGRGEFQLIIEHLEEVGFGALQRAFEQLKNKLFVQGLFDKKYKKSLPQFPKQIGVITSPTGAAIQDILNVLNRRAPFIPIIIYPTLVQGDQAAEQIVQKIHTANLHKKCDLIVLSRGGGSLEDLWSFNEEIVAHAIFDSEIPIVTGIGHEVDFTIADFVADHRAPTPSAAAELISPDQVEILLKVHETEQRLQHIIYKKLKENSLNVQFLAKRLMRCHPLQILQQKTQHLDRLEQTLVHTQLRLIERQKTRLAELAAKLKQHNPKQKIEHYKLLLTMRYKQLQQIIQHRLNGTQKRLQNLVQALNSVSPLSVLARGYAIVTDEQEKIISDTNTAKINDKVNIKLAKGKLRCIVEEVLA